MREKMDHEQLNRNNDFLKLFDEDDLILSVDELKEKYGKKLTKDEVSGLAIKEYLIQLREIRERWMKIINEIDYTNATSFEIERIPRVFGNIIAKKLISAGNAKVVLEMCSRFEEIDSQIALQLIDMGFGNEVASKFYTHKFTDRSPFRHDRDSEVILKLISNNHLGRVLNRLFDFQNLSPVVADKLIELGHGKLVLLCISSFTGLNYVDIADKVISSGSGEAVAEYVDRLEGIDQEKIALKLIQELPLRAFIQHIKNFEQKVIDKIIFVLIDRGEGDLVIQYLINLTTISHQEIAERLMATQQGDILAENIDKLHNLDYLNIANALIVTGQGDALGINITKFQGLNHNEIIKKLIESGQGDVVAMCIDRFDDVDENQIALQLIDAGKGESLAFYFKEFKRINDPEILAKIKNFQPVMEVRLRQRGNSQIGKILIKE